MSFTSNKKYIQAISDIDKVNSQDPNMESEKGKEYPKELLYSVRMTSILSEFAPEAGELIHIAARGQHIGRWNIARTEYPEGKLGYHQWRRKLTAYHCKQVSIILTEQAYSKEEIEQVENLIKKKDLKNMPDAQLLQDVVSLVFLKYYVLEFAEKHLPEKVEDILKKMLNKMSEKAIDTAKLISPTAISNAIRKMK